MNGNSELHVIFGTGAVGKATGEALLGMGKKVRFASRRGQNPLEGQAGSEGVVADSTDRATRDKAAAGAVTVYDCTNPPSYDKWTELLPPMTRGVLAAAESAGAHLVQAGNLYMYGKVSAPMTEQTPCRPCSVKGRLRAMLADEALEAHAAGRLKVTIGRASDFYGPTTQAVMGERALKALLEGKAIDVLGDPGKLHSYTSVEEFGQALAVLGTHPEASGRVWHAPTPPAITTRELLAIAGRLSGKKPKMRRLTPGLATVVGLFMPMVREIKEMLYQFESDFVLDSSDFQKTFNIHPIPLEEGIRRSLAALK